MSDKKTNHADARDKSSVDETADRKHASAAPPPPSPSPSRSPRVMTVVAFAVVVVVSMWIGGSWGGLLADLGRRALDGKGEEAMPSVGSGGHAHGGGPPAAPTGPGQDGGTITIDPVMSQNIGVRIAEVASGPLIKTIRTVGTVDYDETRVRDVNLKVPGWIERIYVDYLGAAVEAGQPLFDFYSPDLFAAQEEYLLAWRNRDKIGADFVPDAAEGAQDLVAAAHTRLKYFDITDEQIEELQRQDQPQKTMTMRSPHSGIVMAKHANEGMRVELGMQAYRIADLSKVWVMVALYEYELPFTSVGQRATLSLSYVPGQALEGEVIYIYPYMETKTRQAMVRLEFDNPGLLLKPGMYANVELKATLAERATLAPRSAVIDTGERQIAFASLGEGRFEPRNVRIGVETEDGMVHVLSGLQPGELVVVSGQFLLDSEAKVREGTARMSKGRLAADEPPAMDQAPMWPEPAGSYFGRALDAYFGIGDALARDTPEKVWARARVLADAVAGLFAAEIPGGPEFWKQHPEAVTIGVEALGLASESDLSGARLRYANLSVALADFVMATGVPPDFGTTVLKLRCPMVRDGQGGSIWLQPDGVVRNPYFGRQMQECFEERTVLPVTGSTHSPGQHESSRDMP
ncbi:MAG: efflux RND transporter periplasmic adaptor subunit [Acidimicrobiia bacterium]|nr:efflux RND transporter periplasmic adaptor subunit [Acidimicrobiia bacterium]